MKKTRRTTEQIIRILCEAEGSALKVGEICRQHSISAQTYYRWKSKDGIITEADRSSTCILLPSEY